MSNPVVSFEIRGPDPVALRSFYGGVFGWEMFEFSPAYAGVETSSHTHNEATGATTYTGEDASMNDGVMIGSSGGQPGWKFPGEPRWRGFETGIAGGIALAPGPSLTFYIQVDDVEAALANVEQHGGSVVRRPEEVAPNVVIAAFRDPAGNEVGLSRG